MLLLEAGGSDRHPLFHMPAGFAKMTKGIGSWGWHTVPQKHLKGRVLRYTQAKVIGGGSSINAQLYTRGVPADYDEWVSEEGALGWSYREVLPYFKRAENNQRFANEFHAYGGPLGVSNPISPLPICEAFFQAGQELGIPFNPDFNGAAAGRPRVLPAHPVERAALVDVEWLSEPDPRPPEPARDAANAGAARGCREQARRGCRDRERQRPHTARAACRSRSDRLLGRDRLAQAAAAVGHRAGGPSARGRGGRGPRPAWRGPNLQDHLDLFVIAECTGDHTYDKYNKPHHAAWAGLQYLLLRNGPVASSLFETGGFWYAESSAQPRARSPDIQFHLGLGSGIEAGMAKLRNAGVTLNSAYLRPKSRGTVRLASADPAAAPLLDPNYWSDPHDRALALAGLRLARRIMSQPALKRFVLAEVLPGPQAASDEELVDYACANAKTDHHPVGTCRIGPASQAASVVTPDLRVIGLEGLRVIDASVMPRVPSCNTNAPTIMVAEKGADHVLGKL